MSSKNVSDIEDQLRRMKEREARLRLELAEKRKVEDRKAYKELVRKKCNLADVLTERYGESILDEQGMNFFMESLDKYDAERRNLESGF